MPVLPLVISPVIAVASVSTITVNVISPNSPSGTSIVTGAKDVEGSAGKYMATAWKDSFEVEAKSTTFQNRTFYVEATYRDWQTNRQYDISANSANLTNFMTVTTSILRDKADPFKNCVGRFITYNSNTVYSGIMDDYTIILKQRAND